MNVRQLFSSGAIAVCVLVTSLAGAQGAEAALGTEFTYQGQLESAGVPQDEVCDLIFRLYDAATDGTLLGSLTTTNVKVTDGLFTVQLDFGPTAFAGDARWLGVDVRCPAGSGTYTPLAPRQAVTATPYALYAKAAPWGGLSGMPAGFADAIDNNTTYSAGAGLALAGTTFSADTDYLQRRVSATCPVGSAIRVVNTDGTVSCQAASVGGAWSLTGNAGTTPGTHYLGTSDNQALELRVNGQRALRLEPGAASPNVVGGHSANSITVGRIGATIAGGGTGTQPNAVQADYGAVGGGANNVVTGSYAAIPGGASNLASGTYSFAAGRRARAGNAGAFVLADSNDFDLAPGVNNAFTARFTGGARFILGINASGAATWLCAVYNGGSWGCSSDRNVKENFQPVDGRDVLQKLIAVPITTWNAIGADPTVRRMGLMAQDFYAAFGLGDDDTVITTGDVDGVALASIQGLYSIVQAQDAQIADLEARLAVLERLVQQITATPGQP
jgi:hypothetical protein